MTHFPITNHRCKVPVDRYLLVIFVFSCTFQGRLNGSPIPTTLSFNQADGMLTVEPPTSPCQNSGPLMYSRYWMAYASVPFPSSTDDPSVHGNQSSSSDRRESISSSADPSSNCRQSISSQDRRLSPKFDYDERITGSPYPSQADMGSPSPSDSSGPRISSWRSINDKKDKDRGSPMILFDERGEMHRNYYPRLSRSTIVNTNEILHRGGHQSSKKIDFPVVVE